MRDHGISNMDCWRVPIEVMVVSYVLPGFFAYGALIGGVLAPLRLLFGFYARIGAIIVAINMLFAFGLAHRGQIGQLNDQGGLALELQGMFLFTAIAIALIGPGRYAINQR